MTRILVAGAGIAGLTTALALGRAGFACDVIERANELPTSGGGIQLSPNATAELERLGVTLPPADVVHPAGRKLMRWRDGRVLGRVPLDIYRSPYLTVRRATLCRALLAEVQRVQGPRAVRFGVRCTGVGVPGSAGPGTDRDAGGQRGSGGRPWSCAEGFARLSDGSLWTGDLIVGADGLRSTVRDGVDPAPVGHSGWAVYRCVIPAGRVGWGASGIPGTRRGRAGLGAQGERFAIGGQGTAEVRVWLGPGRHCVVYPIDGGRALNLVAVVPAPVPPRAGREVVAAEMLAEFGGWDPVLRALMAVAGRVELHGLAMRPAPKSRFSGPVVLVGDAAQPMLPFLAQGAAQGIEDAVALVACLRDDRGRMPATASGWRNGLARYERSRMPRAARVAAMAAAGAVDHHLPDGPAQRERDARLAAGTAELDWLYAPGAAAVMSR
ncbi:FAD-dependent monooxygenase [Actinoplanes sp. RD1]|uniref:FAD-dependent monooxygenase n=1 Tax=Actinoplanes sp. RD1 TaxID=3064538 RepID=UPI0027427032|nr:FAD-dependent monooxygenase [Actinoplanes sp. RD1]